MHFFQWIRWGGLFDQPIQSQSSECGRRAKASKVRTTPKHDGKIEPVLTVLELREMIGCFVADLALAAGGAAAAQRANDPFGESAWVDFSVSGGSADTERVLARSGTGTVDAGIFFGASQNQPRGPVAADSLSSTVSGAGLSQHSLNSRAPGLNDIDSLPSTIIGSTLLASTLDDVVPRSRGAIASIPLAPSGGAVAGAAAPAFVGSRADSSPRRDSDVEIAPPSGQPRVSDRIPAEPFVPPAEASANEPTASRPNEPGVVSAASGTTAPESEDGVRSQPDGAGNDSSSSGVWTVGPATGTGAESTAASPGDASPFGAPGKICSIVGPGDPGQASGPVGPDTQPSTPIGPATPPGPPCTPPGQQSLSVGDPLFVINWNDGLVMAPNVPEFDAHAEHVDLRAQVYGATVQSYSWDTSQANRDGCITGSSTYKLKVAWIVGSSTETTEQITVTATMTDQTTQQMTLTFKVGPGTTQSCPGTINSATWPAVLTPDKPTEPQDLLASDSATRPYAVSAASGVLYVGHGLPAYNPGVPALGLTNSSTAAERRPIFINRYELDPAAAVPNTVSARLQFNGSWGSSKYYDTSPSTTKHNPGNLLQISMQADGGSLGTGRYDYTFETTANYSGSSTTSTYSGTVTIVNEESSVFGEGWTLDLVDRLHVVTGGVILNQGAGNSLWFAESGGTYTTPAGDFSALVLSGGVYTRTLKDGTKQTFNSSGYQTALIDRNNNTIAFAYDGSNNLSTITDPNSNVTTLSYSGNCGASGKVCTITDPANRVTSFSYTGSGRLEKITDPDGAVFTFTYDSSSGRMETSKDPRSNVTTFAYDFAGRVDSVTRPDSTTETFTALQLQSLCDSGQCTSGSPGTPLLAAESVSDYTDARSNAWDTRLEWFGFGVSTQITDPLGQSTPAGHLSVYHRNSNACVTQATDRLDRNTGFTLDSKCNPTTIRLPDRNTDQFEYNFNSQMTKKTDELGRVTSYTYDSEGNLTKITEADPDGGGSLTSPVTTFTYTADGFVETILNPRNFTTTFSYDSRDRVTQITYPDDDGISTNNPKVTLTYDSASNVETRKDERAYTTSFTYDAMNRPKTVTTPDRDGAGGLPAPVTTLTYDAAGNLTVTTRPDPDGTGSLTSPVLTLTYNSMNRMATSVDALGNVTSLSYDNGGNVTAVTDPLSRTTTFTYNELNQQVTHRTPLGNVTTLTYDAERQLLTIKDALNRVTTYTYTNRGDFATITDPVGNVWTLSYDATGNRTSSVGSLPDDPGEAYAYDAIDRLVAATNKLGKTTTYTYDPVGNRTSVTDPLSHTNTFTYDARNRLTVVTRPDPDAGGSQTSPVTSFTYDAAGNRTAVTDPMNRVTTNAYNAANRLTSITQPDPDGGGSLTSPITTFSYDNLDRPVSLKDPVNNLTTWTYDAVDQVLTEIDPLSKTTTYTYDAAGQLTRIVDRKNQRRDFAYDNDGRRTQEYWCPAGSGSASGCGTSTPTRIFTYSYNAANQLTEVNELDSRYTFTYNNAGRVTGVASLGSNMPQVTLTNSYNAEGSRTSVTDNLSSVGRTTFTYDLEQRMTAINTSVGGSSSSQVGFGYDDANRLTSISRRACKLCFDAMLTTFTYDNADRMTALTHTYQPDFDSPTTLATYTYAYNAGSELTVETNKDGTLTYTYDNTSQVTGVDGSGGTCGATGCDETFSYDTNGNRTMTGYTTGTGNRLTSDGTYNYTFDDNGNTLTRTRITDNQKTEYAWDFRNRLTQVLVKDSSNNILQQSDYTYDAFNRRIIKSFDDDGPGSHSATVTKTLYDGAGFAANPYADFNGSNSLTMRYLYGPAVDFILARRDASGTVAWYLADHLGNVRDIANTSGSVIDHVSYSAYGKITAESNPSNGDRFKFTAREFDSETSQHYYRARTSDPSVGRFLSSDPVGFLARDTNLYRYVGNSPTNASDPTGHDRKPVDFSNIDMPPSLPPVKPASGDTIPIFTPLDPFGPSKPKPTTMPPADPPSLFEPLGPPPLPAPDPYEPVDPEYDPFPNFPEPENPPAPFLPDESIYGPEPPDRLFPPVPDYFMEYWPPFFPLA